ncbi:5'-nucleotidase C-terminal domain-containing protein [Flavobacterium filum]|uniref:5'-nucleotidase C-terminal domain-containing protein n=1 Tax=Flavobacterium TaxID=237 RepID=UPI000400D0D9|nr:5'-nucleotidase [Flavobacterium filum]
MRNLKNKINFIKHLTVFTFLFLLLLGCKTSYHNYKVEGKQIPIVNLQEDHSTLDAFIAPYRSHINKDLDSILAYCPETLDKSKGEWQTNIGNFMADVCMKESNIIFEKRYGKSIDICILNHGGIRSIIPKGNVTTRTAFEVMPFENNMVVLALKGKTVREIVNYLLVEKKPHPLSGMELILDKQLQIKSISIQNQLLEDDKTYYVATSDYLANGGDNMVFFKENIRFFDLEYKIRNLLIDYFKKVDTLEISTKPRIIVE